ncbi:hypothetical protein N800_05070 [Lysobacter daejeonensis GH1-9]|uniref:N-acetyltransferase domain-containing protein n=1 Tax=Lysobacter daejeonensis GH1-9 TaxID=1385517 RepID=A0A0A0EVI8_9GAMM|nr:GNAT family N-acetyltransferase [Lysobacter daejeonensis]KGM54260.1 hypothetical protein N800_05070 [Lysobacter daejeonensis GH1-9]
METSRLRLRLLDAGDEALFCHLYTDPHVMRHILTPLSAEDVARGFMLACNHNTKDRPGHRYWAVEDKASTTSIGLVALQRKGGSAELGVMLREGWWSQGISSEAFVPVLSHAFAGMGLELVYAQRPDDDHALIIDRLLGRFGFVRTPQWAPHGQCRWELPRETWMRRARN